MDWSHSLLLTATMQEQQARWPSNPAPCPGTFDGAQMFAMYYNDMSSAPYNATVNAGSWLEAFANSYYVNLFQATDVEGSGYQNIDGGAHVYSATVSYNNDLSQSRDEVNDELRPEIIANNVRGTAGSSSPSFSFHNPTEAPQEEAANVHSIGTTVNRQTAGGPKRRQPLYELDHPARGMPIGAKTIVDKFGRCNYCLEERPTHPVEHFVTHIFHEKNDRPIFQPGFEPILSTKEREAIVAEYRAKMKCTMCFKQCSRIDALYRHWNCCTKRPKGAPLPARFTDGHDRTMRKMLGRMGLEAARRRY